MSKITIPSNHHSGFREFLKLDSSQRKNLGEKIKSSPSDLIINSFGLHKYLSTTSNINTEALDSIVEMLMGIIRAQPKSGLNEQEFVLGIKNALIELNAKDLTPDKTFESDLLNVTTLTSEHRLALKAEELGYDNENILLDVRLLSDIRPVFEDDGDLKISMLIATHKLKISFRDKSFNDEDIYFTLSKDDLEDIKEQIDRALRKDVIIKESLGTTFKFIDVK